MTAVFHRKTNNPAAERGSSIRRGIKPSPRIAVPSLFLFLALGASAVLNAQEATQETSLEDLPGLRERAVVVRMVSRIVEQGQQVAWDSENTRVTIPGRPVGIKLVGSNLVASVQFTPFLRPNGRHILVTHGQIWVNIPGEGMSYHTTMQTIPLEFWEQVYFFPLGPAKDNDSAMIEIQLVLEPYSGEGREPRPPAPVNVDRNPRRTPSR